MILELVTRGIFQSEDSDPSLQPHWNAVGNVIHGSGLMAWSGGVNLRSKVRAERGRHKALGKILERMTQCTY